LEWYGRAVGASLKRIRVPVALVLAIGILGTWIAYDMTTNRLAAASPQEIAELSSQLKESPEALELGKNFSFPFLFLNNTRVVVFVFLAGLVSFSVLGMLIYLINVGVIGGIFAVYHFLTPSAYLIFAAGVLPHGVFELPAFLLGSAAALYIGAGLVTPQTEKSLGESAIELIADWAKIFVGVVVPLMALAALIETYISPVLLASVLNR
jgi:uncharacterized membrane protein SpoIIM required for sporulation